MNEGDPADLSDVWLRILTSRKYVTKGVQVHNRAFGGKAIAPPAESKPYSLEISGRLLSFVKDVEKESREFCKPNQEYSGVIYQVVKEIRNDGASANPGFRTDVFFTPKPHDCAHADVAAFGPTIEECYLLRDWLQDIIRYAPPGNCHEVEKLR